jgi:hypothetical protein
MIIQNRFKGKNKKLLPGEDEHASIEITAP